MRLKLFCVVLAALLVASVPAVANTIEVTPTPVVTGAGPYQWTYAAFLGGQSQVNPGDFFTIFDFAGFLPGSQNSPGPWVPSSALVGVCPVQPPFPLLCSLADDPLVPNLTWTYSGITPLLGPGLGAQPQLVGLFSALSTFNLIRNDFWVSQDQDNQILPPIPAEAAGGNTNVPTAIPEPTTLVLVALGLGLAWRRSGRWARS